MERVIDKVEQAKALRERALALDAERQALIDICTPDERPFVDAFFALPPNGGSAPRPEGARSFDLLRRGRWPNLGRASLSLVAVLSVVAALPLLLLALRYFDPSPLGATVAVGTIFFAVVVVLTVTIDFPFLWRNVSLVLESGSFYFFAGLALLIFAQQGSDAREHPSITFILAMLGVAILLFGTGSQATGALATQGARLPPLPPLSNERGPPADPSGEGEPATPEPAQPAAWGPMKANAIIAGGAAVLTIIFGFGVIHYRDQIPRVFNDYGAYERILVRPCYTTERSCVSSDFTLKEPTGGFDFRSYEVTASNAEGEDLFVRKNPGGFQILALPGEDLKVGRLVQIKLERSDPSFAASNYESSISLTLQLPDPGHMAVADTQAEDGGLPCLVTLSRQSGNCRIAILREALDNREAKTTMDILSLNLVKEAADGALQTQASAAPDVPRDSVTEGALSSVAVEFQ